MAPKNASKKTRSRVAAPATKAPATGALLPNPVMGEVRGVDALETAVKPSKYNAVADRAKTLKSGTFFEVDVPEGYNKPKYRDMIATAIREKVGPKSETGIRVVLTRAGKVAVARD